METQKITKPKPDWITAIEGLNGTIYHCVYIKIDGYNVSFHQQIHKRKIVILWYVDGVWKGEYLNINSEIGAKFGFPRVMSFSKKFYNLEKALNGKASADKVKKKYGKRVVGYLNYWNTTSRLISHLKKTCTEFEVIEQ